MNRLLLSTELLAVAVIPRAVRDETSERGGVSSPVLPKRADAQEPGSLRRPAQKGLTLCRVRYHNEVRLTKLSRTSLLTSLLITGLLSYAVVEARGQAPAVADKRGDDRAANDFFEREVRPILVEHCQSCHGAKKQEAGLRLDSAKGLATGGDSGAVIVPGSVEQSPLIEAVRYGGATKMPPRGKLPAKSIASLEKWVASGAGGWTADPNERPALGKPHGITVEAARDHWAFQPIRQPEVPVVQAVERVATPVDAFVLARLEAAGIAPSPQADRRTLIRRATFDLHGLPPTPNEVAAFEADSAPGAFSRVVQRLLDSPRYGERWGRHWLDVARYSDTKGYVRLNENPRFPSSWTYRDYVIRAFNDDLPFDQFIVEQLAADLEQNAGGQGGGDQRRFAAPAHQAKSPQRSGGPALEASLSHPTAVATQSSLAALGFLTLGPRFLNSPHDIIDDRIDVVTRGLLGLTVTCARCHDHKFDPIPTRDYYSLHGVFASSVEPRVPPLILPAAQQAPYEKYLAELHQRSKQLDEYLLAQHAALTASFRAKFAEYLLAGQREPVQANFLAVMFLIDASKDLNPVMVQRWARFLERSRQRHDPVFAPWHEVAAVLKPEVSSSKPEAQAKESGTQGNASGTTVDGSAASLALQASMRLIAQWRSRNDANHRINTLIVEAFTKSPPLSLADAAQTYARLLDETAQRWQQQSQADPAAKQLNELEWEELRQSFFGENSPLTISLDDAEEFLFVDATTQQQLHAKQRLVTDWIGSPEAAPHAMALEDATHPTDSRVFIRGNASNPGEVVPRQFLAALSRSEQQPFRVGSGRLELARAIASADNPLTARVLVNRVWMHHFGAGLVRTPSDFGLRGERPTHPELLDHLASRFIASGWSVKQLHREIMLSSAYRQQSARSGDSRRTADPENTLLWSMNRRRLDWESLRDALLMVSGQLDLRQGGPSVDLFAGSSSPRRSVYGFIDRQSLPSELRTFDFAPPDASSPGRHQSTVPQQALFLMNGPFLKQQAQRLAMRPEIAEQVKPSDKIDAAHRLLFGRAARPDEIELGERFLMQADDTDARINSERLADKQFLTPWEEYLQVLLLSNEFLFVD